MVMVSVFATHRLAPYTDLYIREFGLALTLVLPGRLVQSGVDKRANSLESGTSQSCTAENPMTAVGDWQLGSATPTQFTAANNVLSCGKRTSLFGR